MGEARVGIGFDSHPRDESRTLRLGGVAFEGEAGLSGHSDADVACHALADALLGAGALGDLGGHFPEQDPSVAGMGGLELLGRVVELVTERGFAPTGCDLVIIAERPRVAEARDAIRRNLAGALGLEVSRVSVKATRPEGLGLEGEGVGCLAVATVAPRDA